MSIKLTLRASVALLALLPAIAHAEAAPASSASAPSGNAPLAAASTEPASDTGLGEIVVTAQRRSENLQKVPIVIASFAGEQLTTTGIKSVVELPQLTPGLNLTRTLVGTNLFLRGVGTTSAGYSTESPVATYIDGLYLPNSAASSFSFNNIERIEVLKGPQGTLYGRNTTGGLINVITKEPGDAVHVDASASYANYDTTQLNFYGSTPLTGNLAANFAALYINQANGWGTNVRLGVDSYKFKDVGFQGKVQWKPGPDTKITLRGFYDKTTTDEGNNAGIYPGSIAADGTAFLGKYNTATATQPFAKQRQYSVSLKAQQDFTFATLTSTTGYINNTSPSFQVQNGIVGQPVPGRGAINLAAHQSARTFSQELQLASNRTDSNFQWITGFFYYHDNTRIAIDVTGTCVGAVCAPPVPTRTDGRQKTRSYSGYAEGTYNLTGSTRVTVGLRYTSDKKSLSGSVTPLPGYPNSISALPPTAVTYPGKPFAGFPNGIDPSVTFNKLTYKAVLAQDLTADVHAYLSYNRGFKSGGYNPTSFTNLPSRPEILDSFEAGLKSELFEHVLRVNLAGFYYKYKDIQLRTTAPPAPPGSSILFNAASARIKGIDADFIIAPARGLTINGGFEILDAKYRDFPSGTCTTPRVIGGPILGGTVSSACNLSGARLPLAPKFSSTLGATYAFETAIGRFELNATDSYKSHFVWEPDNRLSQRGYHLVNAALTWTAPGGRFSVQGFGRNLAGEYYFVSAANGGGNDLYVPGAPRTYGIRGRYAF